MARHKTVAEARAAATEKYLNRAARVDRELYILKAECPGEEPFYHLSQENAERIKELLVRGDLTELPKETILTTVANLSWERREQDRKGERNDE